MNDGPQKGKSLEERIAELEAALADIKKELHSLRQGRPDDHDVVAVQAPAEKAVETGPVPDPVMPVVHTATPVEYPAAPPEIDAAPAGAAEPAPRSELSAKMRTPGYWLNKAGIGLLLLGLIFLFKYSVDRGWLVPQVRIALGLITGAVLLYIGYRIRGRRPHFARVMMGGGLAAWYITGFAAFQILEVVPLWLAWVFMVGVSLIAFSMSFGNREVVLSIIGTVGGLITPFLLYTGETNLPVLVEYTCLVIAAAGVIFFLREWRSLLWTALVGGWLVLSVAPIMALIARPGMSMADQWAEQLGLVFCWLMAAVMPLAGMRLSLKQANKSVPAESPSGAIEKPDQVVLSVLALIVTLALSIGSWSLDRSVWGAIIVAAGGLYWAMAVASSRIKLPPEWPRVHGILGTVLFTIGLSLLWEYEYLFVIGAVLYWFAAEIVRRKALFRVFAKPIGVLGTLFFIAALCLLREHEYLFLVGAVVFRAGAAALNRSAEFRSFSFPHVVLGILSLTLGIWLVFEGDLRLSLLTLEALVLHFVAAVRPNPVYRGIAHCLFALLAAWLTVRIFEGCGVDHYFLSSEAWIDLGLIAAAFAASFVLAAKEHKLLYRLLVQAALLFWLFCACHRLENGQAYVTIVWGALGVLQLVAALLFGMPMLRSVALGVFGIVVGKLILVDLGRLAVVWRILLLMGYGALFLLLSYYFRQLWQREASARDEDSASANR